MAAGFREPGSEDRAGTERRSATSSVRRAGRAVLAGLGLAAVTGAVLVLLPASFVRGAVSNLLTLIAAIYVGFSISSRGELSLARQSLGAGVFFVLALFGLWFDWWWLAVGLVAHGGWDLAHHPRRGHRGVPAWYVPFCAAYDWAVAAVVVAYYMV